MSTLTWKTRNYLLFIYRLESMREGLTWCRKIPDHGALGQRKIGRIGLKPEHLIYIIAQQMGLLARLEAEPSFKIPIDCRRA